MILKTNDNDFFSLCMKLNINYELEYIEVTVSFTNKRKNTTRTKTFPAAEFDKALAYYREQEKMFL